MAQNGVEKNKNGETSLRLPDGKPVDTTTEEAKKQKQNGSFFQIYTYATSADYVLIFLAVLLCLAQGGFNSVGPIIFKDLTNALTKGEITWKMGVFDYDDFYEDSMRAIWKYVMYGAIIFVSGFLSMSFWHVICERQIHIIRINFFKAILQQEQEWFDKNEAGALTTKMSDGIDRIKDGTGDKLGVCINFTAQFIGGMTVAFYYSWKMSLVMLGLLPIIMIVAAGMGYFTKKYVKGEQDFYCKAGSVAEEVINGVRTVMAFNGQNKEIERYSKNLSLAAGYGIKKGLVMGIGIGFIIFLLFGSMGFSFWYGTVLLNNGDLDGGTVFAVFWAFMTGVFSLAQLAPQIGAIIAAGNAAAEIFVIINRKPTIDSLSNEGRHIDNFKGYVRVDNVDFRYPSRPDVQVLNKVSFEAKPGQVVALVGHSGSGKSTIISLLQHFYDIEHGSIHFDDIPINEINIKSLRNLIAVVSQEPVIFCGTVRENLKLAKPDLSDKEMIKAVEMANALEFINKLPDKFETRIGDGGVQLSGGQKQRLAIARALIRDPKVLLLDEATSALDTESERLVQDALKTASTGKTTIVVAHRLSTIKSADKIIVFDHGEIKEVGDHESLMAMDGLYTSLVKSQDIQKGSKLKRRETELFERGVRSRMSRRISRALSATSTNQEQADDIDRLKVEIIENSAKEAGLLKIANYARPEWMLLFFAVIAALLRGTSFPLFSIIYGQTFKSFATSTPDEKIKLAVTNLYWFLGLGVYGGIATGVGAYLFGKAGEFLTKRLRVNLFNNIIIQDGSYFDDLKHSPGRLTARLSTDAPNVRAALDQRLADVVASFSAIISGVAIAFTYSATMAPVGILTAGTLGVVQTALSQYLKKRGLADALLAEEPSRVASEAIDKHKTVQSLTREEYFTEHFEQLVEKTHRRAIYRGIIQSLTYALQSGYIFFNFAASYRYGIWLIKADSSGNTSPYTIFQVIEALNCATMSMLAFATYFPEYVRARLSASIIFRMLEEKPKIQLNDKEYRKLEFDQWKFGSVRFAYPVNPTRTVLKEISFEVPKHKTIALVGPSGCGKSTIIQLLERFYDPYSGGITVNDVNIRDINLTQLRSQIALVGQEPILFNYSIKENISYGLENMPFDKVLEAAKLANAHSFISDLPDGYDTVVGEKGSLLSGGQKQRIAIARAVIREPKLLLLDEATSALDSNSEKVVQEALEKAQAGRTTVTIAHRLTTIQNADLILVIKDGNVSEAGTHQKLLEMDGIYASLSQKQAL